MNKDEIVILITERIKSEHRKHKEIEWERIAAYKIYASLNELFNLHDVSISEAEGCFHCKHLFSKSGYCSGNSVNCGKFEKQP